MSRQRGNEVLRMTPQWIRDKAAELRESARKMESAYPRSPLLQAACRRVATAYDDAATLLDERAVELRDLIAVPPRQEAAPS